MSWPVPSYVNVSHIFKIALALYLGYVRGREGFQGVTLIHGFLFQMSPRATECGAMHPLPHISEFLVVLKTQRDRELPLTLLRP